LNKTEDIERKISRVEDLSKRIDKLSVALIMVINALRERIDIEGGSVIPAIPDDVLDMVEQIISNQSTRR
jgi:hypothetical protein